MKIADYQIHNVLKDFTQQLRRRLAPPGEDSPVAPTVGRRRSGQPAIIRRMLSTIVERVGHLNPDTAASGPLPPPSAESIPRGEFIYQLQPLSGDRVTLRLEIEDSRHLVQRFHDLATKDDTGGDAPPDRPGPLDPDA
jgi:hypothetical protein